MDGVIDTIGAEGGVLIRSSKDVEAVSPALSVAVTNILCIPALRALYAKEIFPLESEPVVEKIPSILDSQDSVISLAISSGSLTCAENGITEESV